MDNGDHHGRQVSPGMRPTLLLTRAGWGNGQWIMEEDLRQLLPGPGILGNDQWGSANAPSLAMEWTMAPGKM